MLRRGFTIVQLMVALAVLALLVLLAVVNYCHFTIQAKTDRCVMNLRAIQTARRAYVALHPTVTQLPQLDTLARAGLFRQATELTDRTPTCPSGGKYSYELTLSRLDVPPKCDYAAGKQHTIENF